MSDTATAIARNPSRALAPNWPSLAAMAIALAAGDFLLWHSTPILSFALFLGAVIALHIFLQGPKALLKKSLLALGAFAVAVIPLLEAANPLTYAIAILGTFAATMILRENNPQTWVARLDAFASNCLRAPARIFFLISRLKQSGSESTNSLKVLLVWLGPLAMASVFIALFVIANPVWEGWLIAFDIGAFLEIIFSERTIFWAALAWFAWPFIEPKLPFKRYFASAAIIFSFFAKESDKPAQTNAAFFQRCLILFNAVFAAQTLLDVTYLWSGFALPEGMSYASYAYRGAYPLIFAALLAALFVIAAMRPGGPGERSKTVKWLVLAWVAQNLMLVASSLFRLELYIAVFGLTYWRIAALIWMALVMAGLVLIVVRFALGRSTGWLIIANVFALVVTLYSTSLINFPDTIARYNLSERHLQGSKSNGRVDRRYLRKLGAFALPAVVEAKASPNLNSEQRRRILTVEYNLRRDMLHPEDLNWRSWSFRTQRLKWYLEAEKSTMPTREFETRPNWAN
ncbi:DUF4173 domain-containing protein [Pseudahrensia aquimaris]|uniref:DUF4173 domain-containing protein n=1 Tax=Pseudahrensia aquimaris TaxID=744461 RepID=A0ABW3FAY2_9HYPH